MNSSQVAPLAGVCFPPVRLSPAQRASYEIMLRAQLTDALREYDTAYAHGLGAAGGAQLAPPWKSAGCVGRLATFKLAGAECAAAGNALQSYRTFGQVQGFYRDILDAHHAESSADLRNLQKLLYPDTLDAAVLLTIRSEATAGTAPRQQQQPSSLQLHQQEQHQQWTAVRERYFGIKWVATSSPSADVRKRDCCYAEMLGYTSDRSGRELAFCVSASVVLPECPDMLTSHQLTRFRLRHAMLIAPTQDAQATSEIFVVGVTEVTDASLGTNAHHRHAMAILNDMSLVIDSRNLAKQSLLPRAGWVPDHVRSSCSVCCRGFSFFFRRRHHCRLCGEVICRTCYVKRAVPSPTIATVGSRSRNIRTTRGGGGGPEMAEDKFCVRCIMGLRAADRCIENFSQQIRKGAFAGWLLVMDVRVHTDHQHCPLSSATQLRSQLAPSARPGLVDLVRHRSVVVPHVQHRLVAAFVALKLRDHRQCVGEQQLRDWRVRVVVDRVLQAR